jgi:hypothetical protein
MGDEDNGLPLRGIEEGEVNVVEQTATKLAEKGWATNPPTAATAVSSTLKPPSPYSSNSLTAGRFSRENS